MEAYKLAGMVKLLDLIEDRIYEWEAPVRPSKIFLDLGKAGWTVVVIWENGVEVYGSEGDCVGKLILENRDRLYGFSAPDWGEIVLLIPPKAR
ncbi:hypothetical protein [Infirmifilum sp. SLHALR2]